MPTRPTLLPPGVSNVLAGWCRSPDRDVRLLGLRWSDEIGGDSRGGRHGQLARDAYDNCLAYVDARLGELVDERSVARARADARGS